MNDRIYYYPIWVRLWHIINALMFLLLIYTGICIQYATSSSNWIRFDVAVWLHSTAGIILSVNYLIFLFGNATSDNGKHYRLNFKIEWQRVVRQFQFYSFGIFKGQPHPFPVSRNRKFNPLQKLTYILSMYIALPVMIITGMTLYYPSIFNYLGLTSLVVSDILHILAGYFLSIFMIIHIYFCTVGHTVTSNFKSMINGWHDLHE